MYCIFIGPEKTAVYRTPMADFIISGSVKQNYYCANNDSCFMNTDILLSVFFVIVSFIRTNLII